MTAPRVTFEDMADAADLTPLAADANVGEPEPVDDFFAQMGREREEMLAATLEFRAPIPTWQGKLVGTFTPLTPTEKRALGKRAEERAKLTDQSQDELIASAAIDRIASSCRQLKYNGVPIPGATHVSGFNYEFGKFLKLPDDSTAQAIARKACGNPELDEFGAFFNALVQWQAKPRPIGADDPFGLA